MKTSKLIIFFLFVLFLVVIIAFWPNCIKNCFNERNLTTADQVTEIEKLKDNFTFIFDMDSADQDQVLYISQGKGKNFVLFLKALKMNPTKDAISKFRFTLYNSKGSYYKIGTIEQPVEHLTDTKDSRKMEIKMTFVQGDCDTPLFPKWRDYTIKDPNNYIQRNDLVIHTQGVHEDAKSTSFSPFFVAKGIGEHICQIRFQ